MKSFDEFTLFRSSQSEDNKSGVQVWWNCIVDVYGDIFQCNDAEAQERFDISVPALFDRINDIYIGKAMEGRIVSNFERQVKVL